MHVCARALVKGFIRVVYRLWSGQSTVALSQWKSQESSCCSVHDTGCLSSPSLLLEPRRIPGEWLVFSLCNLALQQGDRLASRNESKLAKSKASIFHAFYVDCHLQ